MIRIRTLPGSLLSVLFAVVALTGCTKDVRPAYVAPQLADTEVALLKGTAGMVSGTHCWVDGIDGSKVEGYTVSPIFPKKIKVAPGERTVVVGVMQQSGNSGTTWKIAFKHNFQKGNTYEVGYAGFFNRRARLVNLTTKQELGIDGQIIAN
jgi:hypothetical protein